MSLSILSIPFLLILFPTIFIDNIFRTETGFENFYPKDKKSNEENDKSKQKQKKSNNNKGGHFGSSHFDRVVCLARRAKP